MSAGVAARRRKSGSKTKGMGQKGHHSHRVEVKALFSAPRCYGWQIYRRVGTSPVLQSPTGYTLEADAWSAAGAALTQLLRVQRRTK
jgi:hypothetical protein